MKMPLFSTTVTCLVILFSMPLVTVHAQPVYSTILDNTGFVADLDFVNGATLTTDGGVIVAAHITNNASGQSWGPGIVTKLDANGSPMWWFGLESFHPDSNTKHGNDLRFRDAMEDAAGSSIFCGEIKGDGVLLKIKSNGTIKWFKRYSLKNNGGSIQMTISDLAQLPNGNYVGTGFVDCCHDKEEWLWFRTDVNGENPIVKSFDHIKKAEGIKILPQSDNSSVVAWIAGTDEEYHYIYPVFSRVSENGSLLSEKAIELDYNAILTDFIQTNDGGFAAIGNGVSESFLLKLDENLEVDWVKSWPIGCSANSSYIVPTFTSVSELSSGNFYISGAYYPTLYSGVYENLVVITDNDGNLISARSINQSASTQEKIQQSIELPDGRIISLGNVKTSSIASDISVFHDNAAELTACSSIVLNLTATSKGVLKEKNPIPKKIITYSTKIIKDTLTIKTSYSQSTVCPPLDLSSRPGNTVLNVYPNPASEVLMFGFPDSYLDTQFELRIMSVEGILMTEVSLSENSTSVNVKSFPAGLYMYHLESQDGSRMDGIFVKQ